MTNIAITAINGLNLPPADKQTAQTAEMGITMALA